MSTQCPLTSSIDGGRLQVETTTGNSSHASQTTAQPSRKLPSDRCQASCALTPCERQKDAETATISGSKPKFLKCPLSVRKRTPGIT